MVIKLIHNKLKFFFLSFVFLFFIPNHLFFNPPPLFAQSKTNQLIFIPSGLFIAGPPNKQKEIFVDSFYIDATEVTQENFEKIMGYSRSFFNHPQNPIEKIDWYEAKQYCEKVGKRLPTEWEWEKAAKAGTSTNFFWGEKWNPSFAWSKSNADKKTHTIGSKKPNAFGLYDMLGNVWEWTSSDHENGGKVLRGGSWRNSPKMLRSYVRINSPPHFFYHYVGFRCAKNEKNK